jgi:hypothetical protein
VTACSIVAIHGLDGHRERTWTDNNGTLWLRDLLPDEVPNARIFTYGYDARTQARGPISQHTIHEIAQGLVGDLVRERRASKVSSNCHLGFSTAYFDGQTENRPIIFVAHSLGGIVLKSVR